MLVMKIPPQATPDATPQVKQLLSVINGEMTRGELMALLNLKDPKYFRQSYLHPALSANFIEMTLPNRPKSPTQKYRLTLSADNEKLMEKNMNEQQLNKLGKTLWDIANSLRGAMNADDFRDYMLSFLFLRYLSDNYEIAAQKELGSDYPALGEDDKRAPLSVFYQELTEQDKAFFEKQMRRKLHYVIEPKHLLNSISEMARTQDPELLQTLEAGFKYIENHSFDSSFQGLFSEINLNSEKLGKKPADRNAKLCTIITKVSEGIAQFSTDTDILGDAYEYLIVAKKPVSSIRHNLYPIFYRAL